VKNIQEVII